MVCPIEQTEPALTLAEKWNRNPKRRVWTRELRQSRLNQRALTYEERRSQQLRNNALIGIYSNCS